MQVKDMKKDVERFSKYLIKKRIWISGDKILEKFINFHDIIITKECVPIEYNGINGFEYQFMGLGFSGNGYHGSKDCAKKKAAWKWIRRLFEESEADMCIFYRLLKKFDPEMIEIDNYCHICYDLIRLEDLWKHVEECVEKVQKKFFENQKEKLLVECAICETKVSFKNYSSHLVDCKMKKCENCHEMIKKIDESSHMQSCLPLIVSLVNCPKCKVLVSNQELIQHISECEENVLTCRLCGDREERGHSCGSCPVCTSVCNANQWLIFPFCGHILCGEENCYQNYVEHFTTEDGMVICHTCRMEHPGGLVKLRIP